MIVAEGAVGGEAGGLAGDAGIGFSGFVCFIRTCSCSLVLLSNFSGHRLQANVSVFFFVMRACLAAMWVFSILVFSSNCFINCS